MAAGSLLALLDDIASVMDDVALMTKMAGKKTAGVLGDDIALNAQQVSGTLSHRELPIVWAVAKGSFRNKLILVPAALAISAIVPAAITPLLMIGGLYLCYEGAEKVLHSVFHGGPKEHSHVAAEPSPGVGIESSRVGVGAPSPGASRPQAHVRPPAEDVAGALPTDSPAAHSEAERQKIKGAIRTDFILSAEIIAIALGTVAQADFMTQAIVVSLIALIMTVGVYGFVASVVRMDDAGLALSQREGRVKAAIGRGLLNGAPYLMKGLSIVGTAAMFLVGGGILVHGLPRLEHLLQGWVLDAQSHSGLLYAIMGGVTPMLFNAAVGAAAGLVVVAVVAGVKRMRA